MCTADADWIDQTDSLEFHVGRRSQMCGCIGILQDSLVEDTEQFIVSVFTSDPLVLLPQPVEVFIEDEDSKSLQLRKYVILLLYIYLSSCLGWI